MSKPLPNYLKKYRRKSGFTQDEMAFLLGCDSGAKVSRYEHFKANPSFATALAYQKIFKVPVNELIPGINQTVAKDTTKRAQILIGRLSSVEATDKTQRKLDSLNHIITKTI